MDQMKFIFMIYVARSGSTVLAHRLAERFPELCALPEFQLPYILIAEGETRVKAMTRDELSQVLALDPQLRTLSVGDHEVDEIARETVGKGIRDVLEAVVRRFPSAIQGEGGRILLKKGALAFYWREIMSLFPEACFIVPIRDPRGAVNSMVRTRDPYGPKALMARGDCIVGARYWKRFAETVDEMREHAEVPVIIARYEDLLRDCDEVTAAIGTDLNIVADTKERPGLEVPEAEREMHSLVAQPTVPSRGDAWKSELRPWEGVAIEVFAGNALRRQGYDLWYLPRLGRVRVAIYLSIAIAVSVLKNLKHAVRVGWELCRHPNWSRFRLHARAITRRRSNTR